jgi:hypothetical protein
LTCRRALPDFWYWQGSPFTPHTFLCIYPIRSLPSPHFHLNIILGTLQNIDHQFDRGQLTDPIFLPRFFFSSFCRFPWNSVLGFSLIKMFTFIFLWSQNSSQTRLINTTKEMPAPIISLMNSFSLSTDLDLSDP